MTRRTKAAKLTAAAAAFLVVIAGSFAFGRFTADDDALRPSKASTPQTSTAPASAPGADPAPQSSESGVQVDFGSSDRDSGDAANTSPPMNGGDFSETFDVNTGLDRFRHGVFHRDTDAFGFPIESLGVKTWTGDHDASCGTPDSQRIIDKVDRNDAFYMCRDHLMTSVGDVDSYSLAWFSPDQTFTAADTTTVSWEVNITNLLARQWWEVVLVDPSESDLIAEPGVAGVAPDGPGGPGLVPYPADSVAVGNGPFGNGAIKINGLTADPARNPDWWIPMCEIDPEACDSKAIRREFILTDNQDGTITVAALGQTWVADGSFPDQFKVMFKDHNYTPDKDGPPAGHTWHWDNIRVS